LKQGGSPQSGELGSLHKALQALYANSILIQFRRKCNEKIVIGWLPGFCMPGGTFIYRL
jgi:hypothetical protein